MMKIKFTLIWLFVLTAIVAFSTSWYVKRQDRFKFEMSRFEGTWQVIRLNGEDCESEPFEFTLPNYRILLRPSLFEFTRKKGAADQYALYKWDGDLLICHQSRAGYECPRDFDDMWPDVRWDAPASAFQLEPKERRVDIKIIRRVGGGYKTTYDSKTTTYNYGDAGLRINNDKINVNSGRNYLDIVEKDLIRDRNIALANEILEFDGSNQE